MQCPHCGAETQPGGSSCPRCHKSTVTPSAPTLRLSEMPPPLPPSVRRAGAREPRHTGRETVLLREPLPRRHARPLFVTLLAALDVFGALLLLAGAGIVIAAARSADSLQDGMPLLLAGSCGALAALAVVTAIGLWRVRPWGRTLAVVQAIVSLPAIPVGTLVGAILLAFFFKPEVRGLFSGRPPADLPIEDQTAIDDLGRSSRPLTIAFGLAGPLGLIVMLGILAAIVIPFALRARIADDESAAIEQLRRVSAAEERYRSAGGYYDELGCLAAPGKCIPGYSHAGPAFLDREQALGDGSERLGYRFRFHAGPPPPRHEINAEPASPTSLAAYAYTAEPTDPGQTGRRSFCIDGVGKVCATRQPPHVQDGECPAACVPLLASPPTTR